MWSLCGLHPRTLGMTQHARAQRPREAIGISRDDETQQLAAAQLAWVLFLTALPLNAYACHAKKF
jgi:hypothetical protein